MTREVTCRIVRQTMVRATWTTTAGTAGGTTEGTFGKVNQQTATDELTAICETLAMYPISKLCRSTVVLPFHGPYTRRHLPSQGSGTTVLVKMTSRKLRIPRPGVVMGTYPPAYPRASFPANSPAYPLA